MTDTTLPLSKLRDALGDRYRLENELGAGGMATVYLAQDLKHDRQVAIKVLHPELAAVIGADRFLAEIKVTASLQHPHILPLFDSGQVDNQLYYVMPYVQGESLRGRLNHERQLPVPDAVRIATEVASALDYAHRRGVIHRDIKPENILLQDGTALVADFGIALALTAAGGGRLTQTGLSLGTPAYMSPEQAMGEREIGARSDVYALGAITYEMLTGEPPFTGPTAQAIVARTLTEAPRPISPQRKSVPPSVENAVLTALEKLPADRYATAKEFSEALAGSGTAPTRPMRPIRPARPGALGALSARWGWAAGVGAVAVAAALGASFARKGAGAANGDTAGPVRFRMPELGNIGYFSVAPDGRQILGVSPDSSGVLHAWIRKLDDIQPATIPGTDGAERVWLSPDGKQVILRFATTLRLQPLSGGTSRELAQVSRYVTAEWGPNDSIVVVSGNDLLLVSAGGGKPRVIATTDTVNDISFYIPRFLPGGRQLLVGIRHTSDSTALYQMDITTGMRVLVLPNVQEVRYYDPGRILWLAADGTLRYANYDVKNHAVGTKQVILAEGMDDFFANGDLVVLRPGLPSRNLRFYNARLGTTTDIIYPDTTVSVPAFSRDGTRIALSLTPNADLASVQSADQARSTDLWVLDRATGLRRRIAEHAFSAAWSPDNERIAFVRTNIGSTELWVVPSAGGEPMRVGNEKSRKFGLDFTPDGQGLLYSEFPGGRITLQPLATNAKPTPLFDDDGGVEADALFSPDGKWLLYQSFNERNGRAVVRAWPALDRRTVIMTVGNCGSRWGDDGKRIYACGPDGSVMWVGFDASTGQPIGTPQPVAQVPLREPDFDVNPRGLDIVWISAPPRFGTEPLVLAHWRADAERRLQAQGK